MRRPALVTTLSLTFAVFAFMAAPQKAEACSCVQSPSAESAAAGANAVFEGKVLGEKAMQSTGGLGETVQQVRYEVEVLRNWKGLAAVGDKVGVVTGGDSAMCGRTFKIGESYLFYAGNGEGTDLADGLCSRTQLSSAASADFEALGEANGNWQAPEGLDAGEEGGADGGDAPTEPNMVDPFARPEPDEDPQAATGPDTSAPPAAPPSKRGCAVNADSTPAGWLLLLPGLALLRRRRSR